MIPDNHSHVVHIPFGTEFDSTSMEVRIQRIRMLIDWLDQLTDYLPDRYSYQITRSGDEIHIWFLEERDATLCALRWSQGIDC